MNESVPMSVEAMAVVIWTLVNFMAPEQIEAACDHLQGLPVMEHPHMPELVRILREESAK